MSELKATIYECPKCGTNKRIEHLGVVVNGPRCEKCGKHMRLLTGTKH